MSTESRPHARPEHHHESARTSTTTPDGGAYVPEIVPHTPGVTITQYAERIATANGWRALAVTYPVWRPTPTGPLCCATFDHDDLVCCRRSTTIPVDGLTVDEIFHADRLVILDRRTGVWLPAATLDAITPEEVTPR